MASEPDFSGDFELSMVSPELAELVYSFNSDDFVRFEEIKLFASEKD